MENKEAMEKKKKAAQKLTMRVLLAMTVIVIGYVVYGLITKDINMIRDPSDAVRDGLSGFLRRGGTLEDGASAGSDPGSEIGVPEDPGGGRDRCGSVVLLDLRDEFRGGK